MNTLVQDSILANPDRLYDIVANLSLDDREKLVNYANLGHLIRNQMKTLSMHDNMTYSVIDDLAKLRIYLNSIIDKIDLIVKDKNI